jgi:hypothetical protein
MPFVNLRKIFRFFSFDFRQNFDVRTFPRWLSIRGTKFFWWGIQKILSHAEHTRNRFHRTLIIRGMNFRACSARCKMWTVFTCTIHAQHTRNEFYRTLSICGTNFIACWAYAAPISSHAEHARKCLKVEYLGRIEYDFQKSRVTGPWDHMVSVSAKKVPKKFHVCVPLRCLGMSVLQLPALLWTCLSYSSLSCLRTFLFCSSLWTYFSQLSVQKLVSARHLWGQYIYCCWTETSDLFRDSTNCCKETHSGAAQPATV